MDRGRFGFYPGASHPTVTGDARPGGDGPSNTYPGYVINVTADLQFNAPLAHATSCRTTYEVLLAGGRTGRVVTPILQPSKGILVLRHAHDTSFIGGSGLRGADMGLFGRKKKTSASQSATPTNSILDAANEWFSNLPETLPDGSPWEERNGILALGALADNWIANRASDERIKAVLQPMMSMRDIETEDAMTALRVRFEGVQFVEQLNAEDGQFAEFASGALAYALDGMHRYRLAANPEYVKIIQDPRHEAEAEGQA